MTRIDINAGAGQIAGPPGATNQPVGLRLHPGGLKTDAAPELTPAEAGINALAVVLENLTASDSAINDAEFAARTAFLTRGAILAQAGTIVPSLANARPQHVLALLR